MLDLTQIGMASEEDKAYGIDTWARIFKAKTWEELRMAVDNNDYMEETAETMYTLNADKIVRQQCEVRRRAEIEEKYLHDEMERLAEDNQRLKQESENWKEKYEKLLAEQKKDK